MEGSAFLRETLLEADRLCRNVLLIQCRDNGLAGELTQEQRVQLSGVPSVRIEHVHHVYGKLCLCAKDSNTVALFLATVLPDRSNPEHRHRVAMHMRFVNASRKELGLEPLELVGNYFPVVISK